MGLFGPSAKYVKRVFKNEDGSETPVVRRVDDDYELNSNGGVENGKEYTEEWNDPQFGQKMAFGAAVPGLLGGIFGGLAGMQSGNGLQGALMGMMPGLKNAATIGGNMMEYYQPDSKLAAMGAGALSTGATGLQQGLQTGLFNSGGNIGAGMLEGLAQMGTRGLQGGVSAVPGMAAVGNMIPALAQGMAQQGNMMNAVSTAAQQTMNSPSWSNMGNMGNIGDSSKWGVSGNWGNQIAKMTPEQAATGNPVDKPEGPVYGPKTAQQAMNESPAALAQHQDDLYKQNEAKIRSNRLYADEARRARAGLMPDQNEFNGNEVSRREANKAIADKYINSTPEQQEAMAKGDSGLNGWFHEDYTDAAGKDHIDTRHYRHLLPGTVGNSRVMLERARAPLRRRSSAVADTRPDVAPMDAPLVNQKISDELMNRQEERFAALYGRGTEDYENAMMAYESRNVWGEHDAEDLKRFPAPESAVAQGYAAPRDTKHALESDRQKIQREALKAQAGADNAAIRDTFRDREKTQREAQRNAAMLAPTVPAGYDRREGTSKEMPERAPRRSDIMPDRQFNRPFSHEAPIRRPGFQTGERPVRKDLKTEASYTPYDSLRQGDRAYSYSQPRVLPEFNESYNQYRGYGAASVENPSLYAGGYASPWKKGEAKPEIEKGGSSKDFREAISAGAEGIRAKRKANEARAAGEAKPAPVSDTEQIRRDRVEGGRKFNLRPQADAFGKSVPYEKGMKPALLATHVRRLKELRKQRSTRRRGE